MNRTLVLFLALISSCGGGGGSSAPGTGKPTSTGNNHSDGYDAVALSLELLLRADKGIETDGVGNLVVRWEDQSGNGNDAEQLDGNRSPHFETIGLNGGPTLRFDGNDVLECPAVMPTDDYTKVAVFRIDDFTLNNNILSGEADHALFYGGTDLAQMFHQSTFVTSAVPTSLGQTTSLIATFDADTGTGTVYQDGVLVGTGTGAANTDPELQIGAFGDANHFVGSLAEIRLYSRALTPDEVQSLEGQLKLRYAAPPTPPVFFSTLPRDGQLLPRNANSQAQLFIKGTVGSTEFDSITATVTRDGALWSSDTQTLDAGFTFDLSPTIDAGLFDYQLDVTLDLQGQELLVARVENLVCGDAFVVQGQSNALAPDWYAEGLANQSQSRWIRSFGTASLDGADLAFTQDWGMAEGEGVYGFCTVGTWALRLGEILVQDQGIPVAILNGSMGATSIQQHLRNDADPTDTETIYGRLLTRARKARLSSRVRFLLWHQGESDGEMGDAYAVDFGTLHDSWLADFPSLEKTYVSQIRDGCGGPNTSVREVQRQLPQFRPDLVVMSTTGTTGHDGCHFFFDGYRELGDRLSRVVERDLYGSPVVQDIDAPNIALARIVGPNGDCIQLTFQDPDDALFWDDGSEAYFELDDGTAVIGGSALGNSVTLQLAGPTSATTVSYVGHAGDGPWITNVRGIGALTFFDFPISP